MVDGGRAMLIRSSEFWGGVFWFAIAAFLIWAGRDLGLGLLRDPGSGFMLFYLGCIMAGLSLAVIAAALRAPGETVAGLWSGTRAGRVLAVVLLLIAYGLLFERVGFLVNSIVLLFVLMTFIDRVDARWSVPLSIAVPLGVWYTITHALKIQLPAGILSDWIR